MSTGERTIIHKRLCAAALIGALLSMLPSIPARAAATPLPSSATIVVPGHGWGHGRGMGQWGAKGMALDGKTYTQILTHYYSGITLASRAPGNIRVLVERSSDTIVYSDAPFSARWSTGAAIANSTSSNKFLRARYDGSAYHVERAGAYTGPWTNVATSANYVVFRAGSSMLQLVLGSGSTRLYRGSIIARYASTDGMRSINDVSLEGYLYGVVPRESPASWPAEQLKAQAIAARTYAAYKIDTARAKGNTFDICATTQCQVYAGYAMKSSPTAQKTNLEQPASNAAIDATAGKVMLYGGKPILAEFSSSTGGYSAPSTVPYLKPVPDAGDSVSPHHDWTATMRVYEIEHKWPAIGRLIDINITQRNGYGEWGGRVSQMQLVGTSSTVAISGSAFRSAFEWPSRSSGLQSTWFDAVWYGSELVSAPGSVSMTAGESKTITAQLKNTGSAPWPVGGVVRLGTPSASQFFGPGWISNIRPSSVTRNVTDPTKSSVATGEIAEFRIPLDSSSVSPGTYGETFFAIADGRSVMPTSFTVSIQVLPPWVDEAPNLLSNGSFEQGGAAWARSNLSTADGLVSAIARDGQRAYRITAGGAKSLSQSIGFAGGTARRFTFGGWNRTVSSSSSGGPVELAATARYIGGTSSTVHLAFPRASHAWTYRETAFTTDASKQLDRVSVRAVYSGQTGQSYFDAMRILETPVVNASFERGMTAWTTSELAKGEGISNAVKRDGGHSFGITASAGTKKALQTIALSGRKYERFSFSAWNKAYAPDANGGDIAATLTLLNNDGTRSTVPITFAKSVHDWTLDETPFTAEKDFSKAMVSVSVTNQTGGFWFDSVRVARSWAINPSFESGLTPWSGINFSGGDGIVTSPVREGGRGVVFTGSGHQALVQPLNLHGAAGRRFVISGWNRNDKTNAKGGRIDVTITLHNTDGSLSWLTLPFDRAAHTWTYAEKLVTAKKAFSSAELAIVFYDQTGSAFFDSVRARNP